MKEQLVWAIDDRGYEAKVWVGDEFVFVQRVNKLFSKRVLRQQVNRIFKKLELHEALAIMDSGSFDQPRYMLGYPKKKYFGCQRTKKSCRKLNEVLAKTLQNMSETK